MITPGQWVGNGLRMGRGEWAHSRRPMGRRECAEKQLFSIYYKNVLPWNNIIDVVPREGVLVVN